VQSEWHGELDMVRGMRIRHSQARRRARVAEARIKELEERIEFCSGSCSRTLPDAENNSATGEGRS